ncbi:hypothetical protein B0T22DRAFT_383634 [Podospora appendiculata]|uniref:tRNA wybutosine-synthesizing protein 4 n=1 Tax=Podospora appendiculata TaxID=314037 RepID=A0AAE0X2R5_9PEZI|nr:hypothetical protein B0T22DRAFT_383634 [Podospora appendiculata]
MLSPALPADEGISASTPLLHSDTASTLGPASSSASSVRSLSLRRSERATKRRAVAAARTLSFASAVLSSICAGSITVFSLYGHIFQERLHYSQYQVNGLASAASIAMYIPVSFLGYLCDRVGPAPLSFLSALFFSAGYGLAAGLYRRAAAVTSGSALLYGGGGGDGPPPPGDTCAFAGMITAFVLIGVGTCSMYLSAVATCAKNFGRGKHRGLALAVPIAAFGLSGMWQSQVGSRVFYERLADGSKGDVDVFHFFMFLAVLLLVVGLIGTFGLRIVDEQDIIDEAVEELERSGFLDGSALFSPARSERGYGAIEQDPIDVEGAAIIDSTKDADEEQEEARIKKQWVLNAETRRFLTDPTMWCFAVGFFFMIGPGEAFINNLGTIIKTLYPPTLHYVGKPTSAATHVSIVGITSTVVRLLTGSLTDLLAPSPQAQHVQITSAAPMLQRRPFTVSRVSFLLFFAGILSLGLAALASGLIQNHGERFWLVSGLVGAGYGAVFSLTPIIITVIWGVENFATNWGIVAMFPALGATLWGLVYSAVYDAGAKNSVSPGGGDGGDIFCYGVECYAPAFWAMAASVWVACGLVLWAKLTKKNTQTNNSSIVSKRSVEKLYYPDEAHFFRFFVKKFQRRAPLINRGYHFRLHVIDVLVRKFLKRRSADEGAAAAGVPGRKKVVVNLGCGSDVIPWQCLTRYPDDCRDVVFVDVDFPDLMERKRQTVLSTPELLGAFTGVRPRAATESTPTSESNGTPQAKAATTSASPVVFESDQYVQIGCDLRDLKTLREALEKVLGDVAGCSFLFVAEVSITYMETPAADKVIEFAASLGDAEFVLLEQILPAGEKHPFATTMLRHFEKLNTPIKSVNTYSTVNDQLRRFEARGWNSVLVWTLWQAWADETFLSAADRRKLDEVEPFDEWEEFALFASHYCVVHARTSGGGGVAPQTTPSNSLATVQSVALQYDELPGQKWQRRFAAAMPVVQKADSADEQILVNVMGLGTKARMQSCDIYIQGDADSVVEFTLREGGPTSRMCHTLTDLGGVGFLLAGGRASPSTPFKDCWLFDRSENAWKRTHDLPAPLYRHSVARLGETEMALLAGGKSKEGTFDDYLLYHPQMGWISCDVVGTRPTPVYGAALAPCRDASSPNRFAGIFIGGLVDDGVISDQILTWILDVSNKKKPVITFTSQRALESCHSLARFGATCFQLQHSNEFIMLGGVVGDHLLDQQDGILAFSIQPGECSITRRFVDPRILDGTLPWPLLVGSSVVSMPDGRVVILGGGATCFSMGTFWNSGVYTLHLPALDSNTTPWVYKKAVDIIPGGEFSSPSNTDDRGTTGESPAIKPIARLRVETKEDFVRLVREGRPVVLEGLYLGRCVSAWNLEYLVDRVGADRKVVIHDSATQAMDFNAKNFRYVTTGFGDFTQKMAKGDRLYLRALSDEKPAEKPAMLADDFPLLAPDFVLPTQLSLVAENLFSSVLRISGPVNMWLHYDVMANVYCQIGGSKRLILFPPADVEHLSFAPGASSSSVDVFASVDALPSQTHPHEAVLAPGEVLFLPPLWLHTATPVGESSSSSSSSVAVNVFFRDLESGYAAGRDVYGNRDLAAYEKGRQDVGRIANSFQKLPDGAREFYLLRLADELRRKARG